MTKHARYGLSEKGRARNRRHNRTPRRLKAQRERNQVRRETMARRVLFTLSSCETLTSSRVTQASTGREQ